MQPIAVEPPTKIATPSGIFRYALAAGLIWSALVSVSLLWNHQNLDREAVFLATEHARSVWEKDLAFRSWATRHGGVYVPPNDRTPPNPYLSHIPDRDVVTTDGKKLTLMNPAYMMRQMTKEYELTYGVKGKITGLIQLNPDNKPDPWERAALESFEKGEVEVIAQTEIDGQPFIRLMRPMMMEQGCMKCHGHLGYKVGEIRGGVSVSVPVSPYLKATTESNRSLLITHFSVWLLGIGGLGGLTVFARRRESERQRADADMRQLVDQLSRSNAELGRFADIVSHDLQEPVRSVVSYTQLLERHLGERLDQTDREYMGYLTEAALRMREQVADLLEYCRLPNQEIRFEPIEAGQAVKAALTALDQTIKDANAVISVDQLPTVRANAVQLSNVFQHLITNAIKYARPNVAPEVRITADIIGNEAVFAVHDNGIGIEPQYFDQIFIVFKRLHSSSDYPGTGIGLAVCRRVVERHHGRIWVESIAGEGSTFKFTLPLAGKSTKGG